jgi:alpha-tubulin suppressor-like RCC1 family protein
VEIVGLSSGAVAVAGGVEHTCALTIAGGVKCWGGNDHGGLGDGTTKSSLTPVDVLGLSSGVAAIDAGGNHTCALLANGSVKCWGNNVEGQLGDGTTENRFAPVDVVGFSSGVAAISTGSANTCALTTAGGVKCWGSVSLGQRGDGTVITSTTPADVAGLTSGVIAISAGFDYTCAVTSSGGIKCWGINEYGQLGDGTTENRLTPVDVLGFGP